MRIFVTAKPGARETSVQSIGESSYIVTVKEPPKGGKANAAIARVLAEHLGVALSRVRLLKGFANREKVFEVL